MSKQKNTKGSDVRTATVAKAGKRSGAKKHSSAAKCQVRTPWELDQENKQLLAFNNAKQAIEEIDQKLNDLTDYIDGWADKHIAFGSESKAAFWALYNVICREADDFTLGGYADMPEYERRMYVNFLTPFAEKYARLLRALRYNINLINN